MGYDREGEAERLRRLAGSSLLLLGLVVAFAQPIQAQRSVTVAPYLSGGLASDEGDSGCCFGAVGIDFEAPLTSLLDGTLHASAVGIGWIDLEDSSVATCDDPPCNSSGWVLEGGVSRVVSRGRLEAFLGATAGVANLIDFGVTYGARAGVQLGGRIALRIGARLQAFVAEDIVAFPMLIGLSWELR
jgi:hypothetical protein